MGLRVESGRYLGLKRSERICTICENGVEDEIHFLFTCDSRRQTRSDLYAKLPELLNNANLLERFEILCNYLYIFGKYLETLWNERNKLINEKTNMV